MSKRDRAAILRAGAKVGLGALRYNAMVRRHSAEPPLALQQRVYDFEDVRTFRDLTGDLPADAAKLFETVVTRSAGDVDEISAGCGIGYFSPGLLRRQGPQPQHRRRPVHDDRGGLGQPGRTGAARRRGPRDRAPTRLGGRPVRRRTASRQEVEARAVVLATTASVAHRVGVDLAVRRPRGARAGGLRAARQQRLPHRRDRTPGPGTPPTRSRPPRARSRSRSTTRAWSAAPRRRGNPGEA